MIAGNPNVELLTRMVEALGDLRERFVFVGGCVTSLLITDPAAPQVRTTHDVDAIVAIVSLPEYQLLGKALRDRGFVQTLAAGEPPYRWVYAGMQFDVLPVGEKVLGFTNRWYGPTMRDAAVVQLESGLEIRLASPAHFIATKLEAFEDRGRGDYLESHDLEDVLSVVDGRPELVAELAQADPELRAYVGRVFARLAADTGFLNVLPGLIIDGGPALRMPIVLDRLQAMAAFLTQ